MNKPTKCPLCKGTYEEGTTTYAVDLGSSIIIVREVPVFRCMLRGEEYIADEVMKNIQNIIDEAKRKEIFVEITKYKAA